MKAKTVLICVVLLAAVSLAGCISRTGTGTGENYSIRADSAPEAVVIGTAPKPASQVSASSAK